MAENTMHEMTIFLKTGDALTVVNYLDELRDIAEELVCSDCEYDGGSNPVEIRGVRLRPSPSTVVLLIQPWNVAAVQLVEMTTTMMRGLKMQHLRGKEFGS